MTDQEVTPPRPPQGRGWSRRQKQGAGVLGTLASLATILTLFLTLGQSAPAPGAPPSVFTPPASAAYPAAARQQYLTACDNSGSATPAQCSCMMAWFTANISYTRFEADNQLAGQGIKPADLTSAQEACS
jgi:hypothetical protein